MSKHTSKWTPGPWEVDIANGITARIKGGNRLVAKVVPTPVGDERATYDRRLIAAAPDLLEALKAMTDRWEPDTTGADRRMWEAACAAIAKAEGA